MELLPSKSDEHVAAATTSQETAFVLSPESAAGSDSPTPAGRATGGEQALDLSNAGPAAAVPGLAGGVARLKQQEKQNTSTRKDTFDFEPSTQDDFYNAISPALKRGTAMLKVSAKKVQRRLVRIKPEAGQLLWESKHAGILNIEAIRELRFGADARGFREQFKVAPDCESRWISIIYTSSGRYKILHLVALTSEDFKLWRDTLQTLYDQRKELMGGLDQMRKRQAVWLKQHWSNADINEDQKLDMADVETLCRNLNISASPKAIRTNFERADVHKRGYLDFADFQLFVKYLRRRPEVEEIMRSLSGSIESVTPEAFKKFLREVQKSTLADETIDAIYSKFSENKTDSSGAPMRIMTNDGFTSFLMSSDNMAFSERQLRVCDDMTRPLCEYYISSSHNTYLVGGQLTGDSTSEGYIRALQQGCRTVELDVWDGPDEPVVYHGRTLTSRLPVRDALTAIAKYAFVASPYPVILSMEVHCDHAQQDKLADILRSTLGKALVDSPLFGETINEHLAGAPTVDKLPSPENLKYRILVKAKNLWVIKQSTKPGESLLEASEDSSSSAGSSDSDIKKGKLSLGGTVRHVHRVAGQVKTLNRRLKREMRLLARENIMLTLRTSLLPRYGYTPAFSSALRLIRPGSSNGGSPTVSPPATSKQPNFSFNTSNTHAMQQAGPAPLERQQMNTQQANLDPHLSMAGGGQGISGRRLSLQRLRSRSDTSTQSSLASTNSSSSTSTAVVHPDIKKDKPLMSLSLAALLIYTIGVKWRGLNRKEQYEASHIVSLGERRANKIIKDARKDVIAHCRTHLVRSYPAGTRFTSSNYLPIYYWAVGIQLVSLNWQTYDLGTEINFAFFQRNGRSGYILKPDILRFKKDESKDKEIIKKIEKYKLHVEILSAQQLPKPKIYDPSKNLFTNADEEEKTLSTSSNGKNLPLNPFVEVTLYTPTVARDDVQVFRTGTVLGNGFNPVFSSNTNNSINTNSEGGGSGGQVYTGGTAVGGNGGKFTIPFTVPPDMLDLAFVRMEVQARVGNDEVSLGKYTVSLPVLMPGYRHVPLYDHLGQQYLFSSLFIYTRLEAVP